MATPTVAAAKLVDLVTAIMHGAGCNPDEAKTVAGRLVDSNLVGHDSHGVLRVSKYLEWMRDGTLKPNTPPTIVFDSDTIAIVDGNRGFGQVNQFLLFRRRLASDDQRIGEIAAISVKNAGKIEDHRLPILEDFVGRRTAMLRRAGRNGEVAI